MILPAWYTNALRARHAWSLAPALSGLDDTEVGYETGLGWCGVKWNAMYAAVALEVSTPAGTNGTVALPGTGPLQVDGSTAPASEASGLVQVGGGLHTVARSWSLGWRIKVDSCVEL